MIQIQELSKSYNLNKNNQVDALKEIHLSVEKGETLAIVGRSGAGKSTLLHILGCLEKPTKGTYFLDGKNVFDLTEKELAKVRNQKIGFVLQEFGLLMNRTVFENVTVPLMFNKNVPSRDLRMKVVQSLEMVEMEDKIGYDVVELSGGQKQRVAIARAIINDQDIILADEPTGALDTKTAQNIMELFLDLSAQGKTVVIVTHDLKIAQQCNRMIHIDDGKILLK
ncbi:MAG: ABC transporter ATP-binding protein [Lachnospiraceae bacterium]|nr:ABC transporter ATP-binding protein [Lachnospiraceae bacterium]